MFEIKNRIDLKDIAKLQRLYIEIFSEEDNSYPDRRIIANKERAVQRVLDKITSNSTKQEEIYDCIVEGSWDRGDYTFNPICNRLQKLGYKIN